MADTKIPGANWVPMVYANGTYTTPDGTEGVEVAEHTEEAVWFRYHNSEHTFPVTPSEWPHIAYAIKFDEAVYGPRYARYSESFDITEV
jgi:hypothetical protein